MSVRPHPKDPKKWVIDYYPQGRKGRRVRKTIECSEAEAHDYEAQLRRSHDVPMPVNPKIKDVLPDWKAEYRNDHAPATFDDLVKCLKHLQPVFGNVQFSRLTPALIEQYKSRRLAEGVGKLTITKELSYFSVLITWAVDNGHASPLPFKIKRFRKVKSPKPRIPHPSEMEAMISHIEPRYRAIFLLMYDMGLRRSEALGVKAGDVFLKNGFIRIMGKGGKEEFVPITTRRLREELGRILEEVGEGWLFVNPRTGRPWYSIRKALIRAAEKAGVKQRVYHHLLRHSFGTHALSAGINLRALQGLMRHSTAQVTEGYAHLHDEYLQEEGAKFNDYIRRNRAAQLREKRKKTRRKK